MIEFFRKIAHRRVVVSPVFEPPVSDSRRFGWLILGLVQAFIVAQNGNAQSVDTLVRQSLFEPHGVAAGSDGIIYVTESARNRVLRVEFGSGKIGVVAGGSQGTNSGFGEQAQFYAPKGIILARRGLVVADSGNHAIRLVSFEGVVSTLAGQIGVPGNQDGNDPAGARFRFPVGLTLGDSNSIYVADSKNSSVRKITTEGAVVTIAGASQGLFEPTAIAWDPASLRLWIADTRNHSIKVCGPNGENLTVIAGGNSPVSSGFLDSSDSKLSRFNSPRGIYWTGSSLGLLVADTGNHSIRRILPDVSGSGYSVRTYTGVATDSAEVDGAIDLARFSGPVGMARHAESGSLLVVDSTSGSLRRITSASSPDGGQTGTNIVVNAPEFFPKYGYYPSGTRVRVTSEATAVFYTMDGTEPSLTSQQVSMVDGQGFIDWKESVKDLSSLSVRAFVGTNASKVVTGLRPPRNEIGIPKETLAGIGSTVVVPVVANLMPKLTMKSVQFRVEIEPVGGAPRIGEQFRSLTVSSNGYVNLVTPGIGGAAASIAASPYLNGSTRGLALSAIGTNANLLVENFAVLALLAVPVPPEAKAGDIYTIRVLEGTATSDGDQQSIQLQMMESQSLIVSNLTYLVGDASPAGWFNAGDFGNGDLNNNDVNGAFYAALGIRLPFTFSDAFDAMDVFPVDSNGSVGGDGEIRFLDWQRILRRSLRLDTNNWSRSWASGGVRVGATSGLKSSGGQQRIGRSATPLATGWFRQAAVIAENVDNAQPGQEISVPVHVRVRDGCSIAGLLINASVSSIGNGPAVTGGVKFVPNSDHDTGTPAALDSRSTGYGWNIGSFSPPLTRSNLLGFIRFKIPDLAVAGSKYAVFFNRVDGSPDFDTQYELESFRGMVSVGGSNNQRSLVSDEWMNHNFGGILTPGELSGRDLDKDGLKDVDEFVAGTDPSRPDSLLSVGISQSSPDGIRLVWESVPGVYYTIEKSDSLSGSSWFVLSEKVQAYGVRTEFLVPGVSASESFYRVRVEQ